VTIYRNYSTITGAASLDLGADVARVAQHYRQHLLGELSALGVQMLGAKVFEFGAGWGRNLLAARELGAIEVCGVDVSEEQVKIGKSLGLASLYVVDQSKPFDPGPLESQFDVFFAIDVLEHLALPQLETFATTVERLLRPGGLLVVQVPNDLAPLNPIRCGDFTHIRAFTQESVEQVIRIAGCTPVLTRGMPLPVAGASAVFRRRVMTSLTQTAMRLFFVAQYGRGFRLPYATPNLLAIGRR
jgi:2-polyprenyl-3-methyl-5-hydroxy-6-metoxy-1,4-benzoquinol methylase